MLYEQDLPDATPQALSTDTHSVATAYLDVVDKLQAYVLCTVYSHPVMYPTQQGQSDTTAAAASYSGTM
jgi:hypothetical protein